MSSPYRHDFGGRIRVKADYETRSEADLKTLGAYKYAKHPSTEIWCMAFKYPGKKTKIWIPEDPLRSTATTNEVVAMYLDSNVIVGAHNAFFEQMITKFVLPKYVRGKYGLWPEDRNALRVLTPDKFYCSAAKAAAVAIPRNLEGAAKVMKLVKQKNMRGNRLIKKYMKPTTKWRKWDSLGRKGEEPHKWYSDELELELIYDYCINDVDVECMLDDVLPDLNESERKIWLTNQEMNFRGIQIDVPAVKKIISFMKDETVVLQNEVRKLTNGEVTSALQRDVLLDWLGDNGTELANLRAGTIKEILSGDELTGTPRRVLEIRSQISKTSNKKFYAMLERAGLDGRVRDLALYHGASTGRESGTGLQVHNLPRGTIKGSTDVAIDLILESKDLDFIKFIYGSAFDVFSSCIRGMIIASPGNEIYQTDLNAIECRIVNWINGNDEVTQAFERGEDPYVIMAAYIFSLARDQINSAQRFLGKTAELGCGYQMGKDRFYQTCIEWGVPDVTKALAKKAVDIYRKTHAPVVQGWSLLERAAIQAVRRPGKVFEVCKTSWAVKDDFLWCRLPSGRKLAYKSPTVRMEQTPWGEKAPKLYHWQVHPKNQKLWINGATYGGKLMENITQGMARDVAMNGIRMTTAAGYQYMFQVHDEVVSEKRKGKGSVEEYSSLMATRPKWAPDLPIKAGGWVGPRYKKD